MTEVFDSVETAVQSGGPLAAYGLVAVCDSIPLLPTQPVTIATGAAFGLGPGLAIVVGGQTTASLFCFLVGRTLLGPEKIQDLFGTTVTDVAAEFTQGDDAFGTTFRSVVVLRQSPVIPFSVVNYVLGAATPAPIPALVLGTMVGCVPLNLLYTASGAVVRGGVKQFLDAIGLDLVQAEELFGFFGAAATVAIAAALFQAFNQVSSSKSPD